MKYLLPLLLLFPLVSWTQDPHRHSRVTRFPDIPGYLSLSCDFHIHTVFSDGSVWPDIRVQEAVRDSLDAISLTEHLEYQPKKADIPNPDRNRSHEIASQLAKPYELLVVRGAEITRGMPPGHNNAIFIQDANKLMLNEPVPVFQEARRQGAFVFWNHPNWTAQRKDGIARMTELHKQLIADSLLHGIEVINDLTYSDEALQIALDYKLTIMGTSDIHGLVDWQFETEKGGHRPFTVIFARERTESAIREALFDRRTVALFQHTLVGREEWMLPLLHTSLRVRKASFIGTSSILEVELENLSDIPFLLLNSSGLTLHQHTGFIEAAARSITRIQVKTVDKGPVIDLPFLVLNAVVAPHRYALLPLKAQAED